MKTVKEYDYLSAVRAADAEAYVDYWEQELPQEPTQETLLLRREAYESLSEEARRLIRIIVNAPDDVLRTIAQAPKIKRWSKAAVLRHFTRKWGRRKAERTIAEVCCFVQTWLQ